MPYAAGPYRCTISGASTLMERIFRWPATYSSVVHRPGDTPMTREFHISLTWPQAGVGGLVLAGLISALVWAIMNPGSAERWGAWVCYTLRWAGRRWRLGYVARDIQAGLRQAADSFNADAPGVCPDGIRIEWVRPGDVTRQSFIRDGEVVLRLDC